MINERAARIFCKGDISKIENYEAAINDTTQTWICHHILGEILTRQQLLDHDFYYDVPPCMLKFVTKAEHNSLHKKGRPGIWKGKVGPMKGKLHSEATKKKMSEAQKGEKNHNFGKCATLETRKKMSKAQKGRTSPVKDMTWKLINGKRVYFPKEVK